MDKMIKNEYKNAFSKVHPSDEAIERIMDMTNTKQAKSIKRVLIMAMVIISILCSFGVMANAATDGAVTDAISEVADVISKKVHVLVNGKEVEQKVIISEETDENGNTVYYGEVDITSPDGDTDSYIEFEFEGDIENGDIYLGAGNIDIIINDSIEACVPTTVEAN